MIYSDFNLKKTKVIQDDIMSSFYMLLFFNHYVIVLGRLRGVFMEFDEKYNEKYNIVYKYLMDLEELTELEYNKLVATYSKVLVDLVIDDIIQENGISLNKFDYYVERKIYDTDSFSSSNFRIYMNDLGYTEQLSREDNIKYSTMAYEIVSELNKIFKDNFDVDYNNQDGIIFNSIMDKIDFYINNCNDMELYNRIVELRDKFIDVRNILVTGNLRMVIYTLKSYYTDIESFSDIIQLGNIGLMRAVEKYSPNYNAIFITYAYYWIKQSVRNYIKNDLKGYMNISYKAIEDNNLKLKAIEYLTNEYGRKPTDYEICSYMGIKMEKLNNLDIAFNDTVSLYSTIPNYGLDGKNDFLIDSIEDKEVNVEDEVCTKIGRKQLFEYLKQYLTDKQINILLYRYGFLNDEKSFREIGEMYNTSRQTIEIAQKRAFMRIRCLSRKNIMDYLHK